MRTRLEVRVWGFPKSGGAVYSPVFDYTKDVHYTRHTQRCFIPNAPVTVRTDSPDCCPYIVQYTRYTVHPHSLTQD